MLNSSIYQGTNLLKFSNLTHGFSSCASGNMSFRRNKKNRVISNRKKFLDQLGIDLEKIVAMKLIHSNKVFSVNNFNCNKGTFNEKKWIKDVDGLITDVPGIFLFATYADCLPIFIFDPKRKVVGLLHVGWRGAIKSLCQKTLEKLKREFSSNPTDLVVFVGPSIHSCCFEVKHDVESQFRENEFGEKGLIKKSGRTFIDLQKVVLLQLISQGILDENVEISPLCTACNTDTFYSHRVKSSKRGAMGAVIGLKVA